MLRYQRDGMVFVRASVRGLLATTPPSNAAITLLRAAGACSAREQKSGKTIGALVNHFAGDVVRLQEQNAVVGLKDARRAADFPLDDCSGGTDLGRDATIASQQHPASRRQDQL